MKKNKHTLGLSSLIAGILTIAALAPASQAAQCCSGHGATVKVKQPVLAGPAGRSSGYVYVRKSCTPARVVSAPANRPANRPANAVIAHKR
ncbi:MAG: hypothetical protein JNK37_15520 [Verrucomicrobiales bacterium]|nr:hypothetical protein [Verrucomicrobiales bacterium]